MRACVHVYVCMYMHARTHLCMHSCTHVCMHAWQACMHVCSSCRLAATEELTISPSTWLSLTVGGGIPSAARQGEGEAWCELSVSLVMARAAWRTRGVEARREGVERGRGERERREGEERGGDEGGGGGQAGGELGERKGAVGPHPTRSTR